MKLPVRHTLQEVGISHFDQLMEMQPFRADREPQNKRHWSGQGNGLGFFKWEFSRGYYIGSYFGDSLGGGRSPNFEWNKYYFGWISQ